MNNAKDFRCYLVGLRAFAVLSLGLACDMVQADDWMTWASSYTHDPVYGQRVDQYAQVTQPIAPQRQDFVRSGYRHFRSTLQVGQSADNVHIVEQWGNPVIPYEQWRFPFRPYAVPYDAWGPQLPLSVTNANIGFGAVPGYGAKPQTNGQLGGWPNQFAPNPYGNLPGNGYPGYGYQGQGQPNFSPPGYGYPGQFPLTPPYQNQPWYDGTYPSAPPLDPRSDAEFFNVPLYGKEPNNSGG